MHKRGLAPIVITTLIIVLVLASVAILFQSTKPFLEKSVSKAQANDCLTITLTPLECTYDSAVASFRTERKKGEGDITKVRFVITTAQGNEILDVPGTQFNQLESHTIQVPLDQINGLPIKFDVAPLIGTIVCQETKQPITCREGNPPEPNIYLNSCSDGIDNDDDGWIDYDGSSEGIEQQDPGCENAEDQTEENTPLTECSDGIDNDGINGYDGNDEEGCTNWEDDQEESEMSLPACSDGEDNDRDGLEDYPIDDGCINELSTEDAQSHTRDNLYAYAWDGLDNYTYVLRTAMAASYHEGPWRTNNPALLKQKTDRMPEGHRALFDWDLWGGNGPAGLGGDIEPGVPGPGAGPVFFNNDGDRCDNAQGESPGEWPCPWFEQGAIDTAQVYDTLLSAYKQQGGQLDVMILDIEPGFSIYGMCDSPGPNPEPRCIYRFGGIGNDSRRDSITDELGTTDLSIIYHREGSVNGAPFMKWGAILLRMRAHYLNIATYDAARRHFPNVQLSNYDDTYYDSRYSFPDRYGYNFSYYGSGHIVGTHQAPVIYNDGFAIGAGGPILCVENQSGHLYRAWAVCPTGSVLYEHTLFNIFRHHQQRFRMGYAASDTPQITWLSHKPFGETRDSDLYEESVMHLALGGSDDFIFWNPHQSGDPLTATDATDKVLDDTLKEINVVAGFAGLETINGNVVERWNEPYFITGARAGGRTVWRVTPASMSQTTISESETETRIVTDGSTITFPEGVVYSPQAPLSNLGYWIIQPADADLPTRT